MKKQNHMFYTMDQYVILKIDNVFLSDLSTIKFVKSIIIVRNLRATSQDLQLFSNISK